MNPNPNYLVPREAIDFKTSYELIEELCAYYIRELPKQGPKTNLEIEAKMGYVIKGAHPSFDHFISMLCSLSDRDFVIIGLRSPMTNVNQYFGGSDLVSGNYKLEKERISKKRYFDVKNYLEKENLDYPEKIKQTKHVYTVDFQMPDGSRVTYDLNTDKWSKLKKNDKSSIDIVHRSFPYRLSFSFEQNLEFKIEEFDISSVKSIRIKDRRCYEFQYMEYSMTETVDLSLNAETERAIAFNQIQKMFMQSKNKYELITDLFIGLKLRMMEEHEIEVEIIDVKPLIDTLGRPEFGAYLKRFLRNSEALFQIPRFFYSSLSKDYFHTEKKWIPVIGQYLSEVYMAKIKHEKSEKIKNGQK